MFLPVYEAMGCIMMDHDQSSCLPVVGLIRKLEGFVLKKKVNVIFQYFQTNVRPLPEKIDTGDRIPIAFPLCRGSCETRIN